MGGMAWYRFACPNLDKTGNGCAIHETKPLHCKLGMKAGDKTCLLCKKLPDHD